MTYNCPECGATLADGGNCRDLFDQMLFWEADAPNSLGSVHYLTVICYHLQHPGLYSPEGLQAAIKLLVDFIENDVKPQTVVKHERARVDSSRRIWKIKGTPASPGVYPRPVHWSMTAADVIAGGRNNYCENVNLWARSVLKAIKEMYKSE